MTLESLGSYIRQPNKENNFHRIYRAHLLQEKLTELLGAGVTVGLGDKTIKLWCESEQLAVLARLKKMKILAICHQTLGQAEVRLVIKVKTNNSMTGGL